MSEQPSAQFPWVDPKELQVGPPFDGLFPINDKTANEIKGLMRSDGYHDSKPIEVWRQKMVVVDGHSRRLCAIEVGLPEVTVSYRDFDDEDAALRFAITNQHARRNMTDADQYRYIQVVDSRKKHGGEGTERGNQYKSGKASHEAFPKVQRKTAEDTAKIVGVSRAKVERARRVADAAKTNPELERKVLSGETSIHAASKKAKVIKDKQKGKLVPPSLPPAEPRQPHRESSYKLNLTPEDEAWLATFPIREKVFKHYFDEDALSYRCVAALLHKAKEELDEKIGIRSPATRGVLRNLVAQICCVVPPGEWGVCGKCQGTGVIPKVGACRCCRQRGYLIPGL